MNKKYVSGFVFILLISSVYSLTSLELTVPDYKIETTAEEVCIYKTVVNLEAEPIIIEYKDKEPVVLEPVTTTIIKECFVKENNLDSIYISSELIVDKITFSNIEENIRTFKFYMNDTSLKLK